MKTTCLAIVHKLCDDDNDDKNGKQQNAKINIMMKTASVCFISNHIKFMSFG